MLVERDDGRALLARNANFPSGMFSCLAGFVEPGETLEHAVRREVMEEVGLEVGDVEFRGSQPWPFPHQVMIGFGAQYLSGEIDIDGQEIVEAQWFTPDETPNFPTGGMSIAGPPDRRVAPRASAELEPVARRTRAPGRPASALAHHVGVGRHVAEAAVARRHRRRDDPAEEQASTGRRPRTRPSAPSARQSPMRSPVGRDHAEPGHVLPERSRR